MAKSSPGEAGPSGFDRSVTARRRAVALAGHTGDERAARAGLSDPSGSVRATALGALARLSSLGASELGDATGDPDPRVRSRAAELTAELAGGAVGASEAAAILTGMLADADAGVVEAACFSLGELAGGAGVAVGELSRVARAHPDPLCREAAVAALGAIGDPAGLPAILDATRDKPAVRRRAVLALAPFGGEEVDAALARALEDRDWQVRQAAEDLTGSA